MYKNISAQCNVNTLSIADLTIYRANYEEIYHNKDLHNGLVSVRVSAYYVKRGDIVVVMLDVLYAKSSIQKLIVPRKIRIVFQDGSVQELIANKQETPNLGAGVTAEKCSFIIAPVNLDAIIDKGISSLIVIDTRTDESITTNPYANLLKEQVGCVINEGKL